MTFPRGRARWTVAWLALVTAAACGNGSRAQTRRVDTEEVEKLLIQRQKEQRPSLNFTKASCPSDVQAREGDAFECSVDVEGQEARFRVRVTEVLGQRASYEFRPTRAIVDPLGLAVFVQSQLEKPWDNAQVNCGLAKVRIVDVGTAIDCTAFDGTDTRNIQAVVEDSEGTVTVRDP